MNENDVIKKISTLNNPYTNAKIDFSFFVKDIQIDGKKIIINYTKLGNDDNLNKTFNRNVIKLLKLELGFQSVKVTHPPEEPESDDSLMIHPDTKIIAIMSGKGGVGKSQVTVNIAKELASRNYKVGILDADIYGYSIPKILDLYEVPNVVEGKIIPVTDKDGIEVMSAQYFLEDNQNQAIIWRASMVNKLMQHFFYDVKWNSNLDYLLIDLPPGTGDIALNVSQMLDDVSSIVVTTSNPDASHVALRSGLMAKDVNFKLIGVVENMSYYEYNDEKLFIFGEGGAAEVSSRLNTPILSQIPIENNSEKLQKYYNEIVNKIEES